MDQIFILRELHLQLEDYKHKKISSKQMKKFGEKNYIKL